MADLNRTIFHTPPDELWGVGRIRLPSVDLDYPLSGRDIERDAIWAQKVLADMGVGKGNLLLFIADAGDYGQYWPYEAGAAQLKAVCAFALPSEFDAYRTEMFLRRLPFQVAFGVTGSLLDGLEKAGHDLWQVFARTPAVIAHPDAWCRLKDAGLQPWKLISLGGLFAIESPAGGGASYDETEWAVESLGGELSISSVNRRALPVVRLRTGVRGTVEVQPTGAGKSRRVFLE